MAWRLYRLTWLLPSARVLLRSTERIYRLDFYSLLKFQIDRLFKRHLGKSVLGLHSPSLLMLHCRHFFSRQYWHWFLRTTSITQFWLSLHEYLRLRRTDRLKKPRHPSQDSVPGGLKSISPVRPFFLKFAVIQVILGVKKLHHSNSP